MFEAEKRSVLLKMNKTQVALYPQLNKQKLGHAVQEKERTAI